MCNILQVLHTGCMQSFTSTPHWIYAIFYKYSKSVISTPHLIYFYTLLQVLHTGYMQSFTTTPSGYCKLFKYSIPDIHMQSTPDISKYTTYRTYMQICTKSSPLPLYVYVCKQMPTGLTSPTGFVSNILCMCVII